MVKLAGFNAVNATDQRVSDVSPTLEAEEAAVIEEYERGIHFAAENKQELAEVRRDTMMNVYHWNM